jgi:hypothetical protein
VFEDMAMSSTTYSTHALRFALVVSICALGACIRPVFPGSERILDQEGNAGPRIIGPAAADTVSLAMARKSVYGKEAPATVVAADGSRCNVTKKRFDEVKEGEKLLCAWRRG